MNMYRVAVGRRTLGDLYTLVLGAPPRVEAAAKRMMLKPGQPVEMVIKVRGRSLSVSVDGKPVLRHPKLLQPWSEGRIGVRVNERSTMRVDSLTLLKGRDGKGTDAKK